MGKQIISKQDMWLQPSNRIAKSSMEFQQVAKFFPVGTIFENKGKPEKSDDPDCEAEQSMHGWCYIRQYVNGSPAWDYCNFHAYILDYWREFPDLFEAFEVKYA